VFWVPTFFVVCWRGEKFDFPLLQQTKVREDEEAAVIWALWLANYFQPPRPNLTQYQMGTEIYGVNSDNAPVPSRRSFSARGVP